MSRALESMQNVQECGRKRQADSEVCLEADKEQVLHASILLELATDIANTIATNSESDELQLCGPAALHVLHQRPQEALDLAHSKLHTWPYHQVPQHWRRLYEDASLLLAASVLTQWALGHQTPSGTGAKRTKSSTRNVAGCRLGAVVAILDKAVIVAGAPARKGYIERLFARLSPLAHDNMDCSGMLAITKPVMPLLHDSNVLRTRGTLGFEEFQQHLDQSSLPLVISGSFDHWQALQHWPDLAYLMRVTLGGHRLVPIEIGDNYNHHAWTQRLVPFSQFVQCHLVPETSSDIGYLAQHDLFGHVPALREDISIPDYCYTAPPPSCGHALRTAGLADTLPLDEPLLNAWLGPKGTKTPAHTDPYHNILCQVVGYKYVRLYPPEETPRLYPCSADEAGVNMSNTSQIDVQHFRPREAYRKRDDVPTSEMSQMFPLFSEAKYQEAFLAPGECLYIPLGWWHYVESLTTSFSVSCWWN